MTVTKKRLVKPKMKKKLSSRVGVRAQEAAPGAKPVKAATPTQPVPKTPTIARNQYGYRVDSDVAIVLDELMAGGADKHTVAARIAKRFEGQTTRSGRPKPVSTIMNQVESQMKQRGFTIESMWKLVPPADGEIGPKPKRKVYPRRKTQAAATGSETKPATKKAVKPKPKPKPRATSTRK